MCHEKSTENRVGPYDVHGISGKLATLDTGEWTLTAFIDKIKTDCQDHISKNIVGSETSGINGNETFRREKTQLEALLKFQREFPAVQDTADMFIFKVNNENGQRAHVLNFKIAKKEEVNGLMSQQMSTKVKKDNLVDNANVSEGGFVLTPKNFWAPKKVAMVLLAVQGYKPDDRAILFTTLQHWGRLQLP